jgi:leader peptidase (prepilin peptidase) / N-methyltransferase
VAADVVVLAGAGILGLCLGSFLNVCIVRLPNESRKARSLVHPPSSCPKCKHLIEWRDNIPVLSWLVLRGKCRWCHAPISRQYPIVEALVAVLWIGSVLVYGPGVQGLRAAVLGTVLLGIAVIDWRHKLIPDELNYGGLVLGLALSLASGADGFIRALAGAATGLALLWTVRVVGGWILKQEAMGGGDVKMMAMVGAFLGWQNVLLTVFVGALIGSAVYLPLLLSNLRKMRRYELPFGVFLALASAVVFVSGDSIISWYLQFVRGT